MLALAALLLSRHQFEPLVAYSARFYYQDHRRSYYQVYLSDFHGKSRRALTHGRGDRWGVQWVGKNRIAWIECDTVPRGIGPHGDSGHRLVEYDIRTKRRRIVATGCFSAINTRDLGWPARGVAIFDRWHAVQRGTSHGWSPPFDFEAYVTKNGRLALSHSRPPRRDVSFNINGGEDYFVLDGHTIRVVGNGPVTTRADRTGRTESMDTAIVERSGRKYNLCFDLDGPHRVAYTSARSDRCWIRDGFYAGSAGCEEWMYEVNWKTGTSKCVIANVLDIDFGGDLGTWASLTTNKNTDTMGKIQVWVCDVCAGDIRTGKRWKIASGFVHATSVSVQPN
ncbi:MAG: hypothetical protein JSS72_01125 [Armatimonadetes bacterium]|nr:hypothetical protein [Armatimonadota bacterium]